MTAKSVAAFSCDDTAQAILMLERALRAMPREKDGSLRLSVTVANGLCDSLHLTAEFMDRTAQFFERLDTGSDKPGADLSH